MAQEKFAQAGSDLVAAPSAVAVGAVPVAPQPTGGQGLALDPTGHLPASLIKGYPNDKTKSLFGDGTWKVPAASVLTGLINGAAGTVIAGTGFSVVRNGTGNWTVTFTSAFSAIPVILLTVTDGTQIHSWLTVTANASGSFSCQAYNNNSTSVDLNWNFLVYQVQ